MDEPVDDPRIAFAGIWIDPETGQRTSPESEEATVAKLKGIIEGGLLNQPKHIQQAAGILEWAGGWELPNEKQLSLMHPPKFIQLGGMEWSGIGIAGRIDVMAGIEASRHFALKEDIMDVLCWLPAVKIWLADWQKEINTGSVWNVPGRFGAAADDLLEHGALLHSPQRITGWWGQNYPTREEVPPGEPGSPDFVRSRIGQTYLDWISSIE